MELRNRATGAVITDSQFRAENRNTSFPRVLTPEIIDNFGYDPVLEGPQATTIPPYEYSQRSGVVQINGQWFTNYTVGPVFSDYEKEDGTVLTAAEQEAEYRARIDEQQAENLRKSANYTGFYDGLLTSIAYQAIRAKAIESLALTVACTEFIAAISDAKFGRPNEAALQACINNIVQASALEEEELVVLGELMVDTGLDKVYTIPGAL